MDIKADFRLYGRNFPINKGAQHIFVDNHCHDNNLLRTPSKDIFIPSFSSKSTIKQQNSSPKTGLSEKEFKAEKAKIEKILHEYSCQEYGKTPEEIAEKITPDNIEIAKIICKKEKFEDKAFEMLRILNSLTKENYDLAKQICIDDDFPVQEISKLMDIALPNQIEFAKYLAAKKDFPKKEIKKILWYSEPDTFDLAQKICISGDFPAFEIAPFLSSLTSRNRDFAEELYQNKDFPNDKIALVISNLVPESADIVKIICRNKTFPKNLLEGVIRGDCDNIRERIAYVCKHHAISPDYNEFAMLEELKSGSYIFNCYNENIPADQYKQDEKILEEQKKKCLKNPDLYVDMVFYPDGNPIEIINEFFNAHQKELISLTDILGKAALDDFMRYKIDSVADLLDVFKLSLCANDFTTYKNLINSKKSDGQDFSSIEKVRLISTLLTYKNMHVPMNSIHKMIANNSIDVPELHYELLKASLEDIHNVPKEKLQLWDMRHIHLFLYDIVNNPEKAFFDIFAYTNTGIFKKALHAKDNVYGCANHNTMKIFNKLNMNYQAWLEPSKDIFVKLKAIDENKDKLKQIQTQIVEDIETLRDTAAKKYIDKVLADYIKNNKFVIPANIKKDKEKTLKLIHNLIVQLGKLWERAEKNKMSTTPSIAHIAANTLLIKNHLEQRIEDINSMGKPNTHKEIDYTIKMWDRNPYKDLFQGNYSTCCIGMGSGNSRMMPHYLLNTAFNMMEVIDNKSGETIGNALLYYVKNHENKPVLVMDNIEINNREKPSEEIGIKLRKAMTQFARNVNKEVLGSENAPLILGARFNDVSCTDLEPSDYDFVSLVGDVDCDSIYLDLFKGIVEKCTCKPVKCFELVKNQKIL